MLNGSQPEAGLDIDAALNESRMLARKLGLPGTPSYVVRNNIVVGAVGVAALRESIAALRK